MSSDTHVARLGELPVVKDAGSYTLSDVYFSVSVRRDGERYVGCYWPMHTPTYLSPPYATPEEAERDAKQHLRDRYA